MDIRLVANIWETPDGTIMWSRYGHDCVFYDDANGKKYMVDGGNDYVRLSAWEEAPLISRCIYSDAPYETKRQYILRGTFDEDGHRIFVPLNKLSNKHLENIVADDKEIYGHTNTVWEYELKYRNKHNIVIPEHSYNDEKVESIIKPNKQ